MMRSVSSIVLATTLGVSGCTSAAETADDGACPRLLNDAVIRDDPAHPQYRALVACQVAALTEAVSGRLPDAPERCRVMEAVVERLDLSSFGSSLGPRIGGAADAADRRTEAVGRRVVHGRRAPADTRALPLTRQHLPRSRVQGSVCGHRSRH